MSDIRPEFKVHMLNDAGKEKARKVAEGFSMLLSGLELLGVGGRELALVKTNLETACFNAKRGIASVPENQE